MYNIWVIGDLVGCICEYLSGPDTISLISTCKTLHKYISIRDTAYAKFTLVESLEYESIQAITHHLKNMNIINEFTKNYIIGSTEFLVRVIHKIKDIHGIHAKGVLFCNPNLTIVENEYLLLLDKIYSKYSKMFRICLQYTLDDCKVYVKIEIKDVKLFAKFANKFPDKAIHILQNIISIVPNIREISHEFIKRYVDFIHTKNKGNKCMLSVFSEIEYFWECCASKKSCLEFIDLVEYVRVPYTIIKKYAPHLIFNKFLSEFNTSEIMQIAQDLHNGEIYDVIAAMSLTKLSVERGWPALCSNLTEGISVFGYDISEGNAIHFICDRVVDVSDPKSLLKYIIHLHSNIPDEYQNVVEMYSSLDHCNMVLKMHQLWDKYASTIPFPQEWEGMDHSYISDELFGYALEKYLVNVGNMRYLPFPKSLIYLKFKMHEM